MTPQNLTEALREYLTMRRGLGVELYRPGKALENFVRFVQADGQTTITTDVALRWAMLPVDAQPATRAARLGIVRGFARYCSAFWPATEVPPEGQLSGHYQRKAPFIFTEEQICALLDATAALRTTSGLRPLTYKTAFGLMSSTGLRISEVLALEDADVDLTKRLLLVRNTKFGKTRWAPLHDSTARALRCYRRDRDARMPTGRATSYFVGETGNPLSHSAARSAFHHLLREVGLHAQQGRRPRMHDLRHTFIVATVAGWYRRGLNVDARMPALSTYVGHTHVADTYWYMSAAPELLHWTARRVERAAKRKEHS